MMTWKAGAGLDRQPGQGPEGLARHARLHFF